MSYSFNFIVDLLLFFFFPKLVGFEFIYDISIPLVVVQCVFLLVFSNIPSLLILALPCSFSVQGSLPYIRVDSASVVDSVFTYTDHILYRI
jgi:hypothetical protein